MIILLLRKNVCYCAKLHCAIFACYNYNFAWMCLKSDSLGNFMLF